MIKYASIKIPDHPIAPKSGHVLIHRKVLFDKVGAGEHPCHWCGRMLIWGTIGPRDGYIIGDHLNGSPSDNSPENMVVACTQCNSQRARTGRIQDWEPFIRAKNGGKQRAELIECEYCHVNFLSPINSDGLAYRKYCSQKCNGKVSGVNALKFAVNPLKIKDGEVFVSGKGRGDTVNRARAEAKTCQRCGNAFLVRISRKSNRGQFCSQRCNKAARPTGNAIAESELYIVNRSGSRQRAIEKNCISCGQAFLFRDASNSPGKYCSYACAMRYRSQHGDLLGIAKTTRHNCIKDAGIHSLVATCAIGCAI